MSCGASQPIIAVSQGGASVVAFTITGMHQDHHYPLPTVVSPETNWHCSTNAFQVATPGMLAVPPNVTVTRGTSATLSPQVVLASGHAYSTPLTTPQPNTSVASGRSPAFSRPPTTAPSAFPRPRPRKPPTALSNPSYRGPSSDNQGRADSRGFHCAEGTSGGPKVGRHARKFADPRVAPRYIAGPESNAEGAPIARKYLDAAWGVTPGTKRSLGLTD